MLISYFSSLFISANPSVFEPVIKGELPRVSRAMNEDLLRPFESEEAKFALKQMDADMAPGPNGFPPFFFIKNFGTKWEWRSQRQSYPL